MNIDNVKQDLRFGDKVMLLDPEMHFTDRGAHKPGDLYAYIKVGGDGLHELVTKYSTIVYVLGEAIKNGFAKCGHCESCKRYYYAEHCGHVCQKDDMFLDCPDWQSCTNGWELSNSWAEMEIAEHAGRDSI